MAYSARDVLLARKAKKAGAKYYYRIIREARAAGLPISLGFAIIQQESNFTNVFGHDPVKNPVRGGTVTKERYLLYKKYRKQGLGMQGVGPAQLTWYEFQDAADKLGGCWKPTYNIRVAFRHLAYLTKVYGTADGIRRYNGSGDAAERYKHEVLGKQRRWHKILS